MGVCEKRGREKIGKQRKTEEKKEALVASYQPALEGQPVDRQGEESMRVDFVHLSRRAYAHGYPTYLLPSCFLLQPRLLIPHPATPALLFFLAQRWPGGGGSIFLFGQGPAPATPA